MALGHTFVDPPAPGEIGAATGIELRARRPAGRGGRAGPPRRRQRGRGAPSADRPALVRWWGDPLRQGSRHGERLRAAARPRRRARPHRRRRSRRLCDRRAGIGADGVLRVVRTAADADGAAMAGRGASGSWTTATPTARPPRCAATASGCSRGYLVDDGLAEPRRARDRHPRRRQAGCGSARPGTSPSTWVRPGCPAPTARCARGPAGSAWLPAVEVDVGNPHAVVFVDDLADAGELAHAAAGRARLPRRRQRRVRRPPRRAARRDARARARRRRDPVLRHRCVRGHGGGSPARRTAPPAASTYVVDVPGGRLTVTERADGHVELTGPAVLVADGRCRRTWLWPQPS